jgi:heavy metal translocating P-type ATPase
MTMLPIRRDGKATARLKNSTAAAVVFSAVEATQEDSAEPSQSDLPDSQQSEVQAFDLYLVNEMPGRLRFYVPQVHSEKELGTALAVEAMRIEGVTSARVNTWCGALIVTFDQKMISNRVLIDRLSEIPCLPLDSSREKIQIPQTLSVGRLQKTLDQAINFLERALPPFSQLVIAGAGFVATLLEFPQFITRALLSAAIVPITVRAARTLLDERKIGVDALDGCAAVLMMATGKVTEACFMTLLISLGEYIREKTAQRCRKIVDDLLGLSGRNAWLVVGRKRICVSADEVKVGDNVVIYPGELVPVDGLITAGRGSVDQSKLTGESLPVDVTKGGRVYAATVLLEGKIYVQCESVGMQTKAGCALESMKEAPLHETKIQNYAALMADRLVVPIMLGAGICFGLTHSVVRMMSMLIFDFSTGIRIAAPTAVLSSMHRAGRRGILIKNGAALERLSLVNAVIFDKTGTLTSGEPRVTRVVTFDHWSESEVMAYAAAVEQRQHHPASRAIIRWATQNNATAFDRTDSQCMRGMGVQAKVNEHTVLVGSRRLMESEKIDIGLASAMEKEFSDLGESLAYIAIEQKLSALVAYKDQVRPEAQAAIAQLKKLGIKKLVMATGDGEQVANQIARTCGIEDVLSRAFPEQKAELVKQLKSAGYTVAVIGDGINDSPALAYADVALSLHGGTEAAKQGADIILTDGDLRRLPEGVKIARAAIQLVRQNLSLAMVPNSAGLFLAAAGLVGPAGSTLLNNGSAIAAAFNSLRPLYSDTWSQADPVAV